MTSVGQQRASTLTLQMEPPPPPTLNPAVAVRAVMSWRDKYIKEEFKPSKDSNDFAPTPIRPPDIAHPASQARPTLCRNISHNTNQPEVSSPLDSESSTSQDVVRSNSGNCNQSATSFRPHTSRPWIEDRSGAYTKRESKYFGGRTSRGERDPSIPSIRSGRRYHPTTGRIYYDDSNPNPLWPSSAPTGPAIDPLTGLPDSKKQKTLGNLPRRPKEKRKVSFQLPPEEEEESPESSEEEGEVKFWEKRSAWDEYKSGDSEAELSGKSESLQMLQPQFSAQLPSRHLQLISPPANELKSSTLIASSSPDSSATNKGSPSPEPATYTVLSSSSDTTSVFRTPPTLHLPTAPVELSAVRKLPSFKKRKSAEIVEMEDDRSKSDDLSSPKGGSKAGKKNEKEKLAVTVLKTSLKKHKFPVIAHSDSEEESSELTELVPSGDLSAHEDDNDDRMSVQEDSDGTSETSDGSSDSENDMDMSDSESSDSDSDSLKSESESAVSTGASNSSSESFHPSTSLNATGSAPLATSSSRSDSLTMPKVGSIWRTRELLTETCRKASAAAGYGWKSVHGYGSGKGREVIWGCTRITSKARFDEGPCPARQYYKPVNPNKWETGKWRIHRAYEHNHPPEKDLAVAMRGTRKRKSRGEKMKAEVEVLKKRGPGRPRKIATKVEEKEVSEDELESDTEEEIVLRKRVKTWVAGTQGPRSASIDTSHHQSDRPLTPTPPLPGRQTNNSASTRLPTPPPSLVGSPSQRTAPLFSSVAVPTPSPPPPRPAPRPSSILNKLAKARYISEAEPNDISSFLCSLDPTLVKYTSNLTVAGLREKSQIISMLHWSRKEIESFLVGCGIPKKICGKMVSTLKVASDSIVAEST